jgi:parallel beta-helix repeat protein
MSANSRQREKMEKSSRSNKSPTERRQKSLREDKQSREGKLPAERKQSRGRKQEITPEKHGASAKTVILVVIIIGLLAFGIWWGLGFPLAALPGAGSTSSTVGSQGLQGLPGPRGYKGPSGQNGSGVCYVISDPAGIYTASPGEADLPTYSGSDAALVIQDAINATESINGGLIQVESGIYNITTPILIGNEIDIQGEGMNTLFVATAQIQSIFDIENAVGVCLSNFFIDDNVSLGGSIITQAAIIINNGAENIVINDLVIFGDATTNNLNEGIYITFSDVLIENSFVLFTKQDGIRLNTTSTSIIQGNTVEAIGGNGITASYSTSIQIYDNSLMYCGGNCLMLDNTGNCHITNNYFDYGVYGCYIDGVQSTNNIFSGNTYTNNNQCGLYIISGSGTIITGDQFHDNNGLDVIDVSGTSNGYANCYCADGFSLTMPASWTNCYNGLDGQYESSNNAQNTGYSYLIMPDNGNFVALSGLPSLPSYIDSDAATVINEAMQSLRNMPGGIMKFIAGIYPLSTTIRLYNAETLDGSGAGTIFYPNSSLSTCFEVPGGDGDVLENFAIDCTQSGSSSVSEAILFASAFQSSISNIEFYDSGSGNMLCGIEVDGSASITDCTFDGVSGLSIFSPSAYGVSIEGCNINGINNVGIDEEGVKVTGGIGLTIQNCQIGDCAASGIDLSSVTSATIMNCQVTGCSIDSQSSPFWQANLALSNCQSIDVLDNILENSGTNGCFLSDISSCTFTGNTYTSNAWAGLFVSSNSQNNTFSQEQTYSNVQNPGSQTYYGIEDISGCNNSYINCMCTDGFVINFPAAYEHCWNVNYWASSTQTTSFTYIISQVNGLCIATPNTSTLPVFSSTDATTTIQNALNAIVNGGIVQVQSGIYVITNPGITIPNNIIFEGVGPSTIFDTDCSNIMFWIQDNIGITLENFEITDTQGIGLNFAILVYGTGQDIINNVAIIGNTDSSGDIAYGITGGANPLIIENCNTTATLDAGIYVDEGYAVNVQDCQCIGDLEDGIYATSSQALITIQNCIIQDEGLNGIDIDSNPASIQNNQILNCLDAGIRIAQSTNINIIGNTISGCGANGYAQLWIDSCDRLHVTNNYILNGFNAGCTLIESESCVFSGNTYTGNAGDGVDINAGMQNSLYNIFSGEITQSNGPADANPHGIIDNGRYDVFSSCVCYDGIVVNTVEESQATNCWDGLSESWI